MKPRSTNQIQGASRNESSAGFASADVRRTLAEPGACVDSSARSSTEGACRPRRRFLAKSAAAALIAVLGGRMAIAIWPKKATSGVLPQLNRDFARLDAQMAQGGPSAISAQIVAGTVADHVVGHRWIAERGHQTLFSLLLVDLVSPTLDIRMSALSALESVPAVQLKPHLASMRAAASNEGHVQVRRAIEVLANRVARS